MMPCHCALNLVAILFVHQMGQTTAVLPEVEFSSAVVMSAHELRMTWDSPGRTGGRGRTKLRFNVRYRPTGGVTKIKIVNRPEVKLSGLTPNTTYVLAVRSQKGLKYSAWSKLVERTTLPLAGSASGNSIVLIKEVGAFSVRISWRLTDNRITRRHIKTYQVTWQKDRPRDVIYKRSTKKSRYTITDLEPGTTYLITVTVVLKAGGNQTLQKVKVTTEPFVLPPPSNPKFTKINSTFLALKWRHVKVPNEESPIDAYEVEYSRINALPEEVCRAEVPGTSRTYKIRGLLPDEQYMVRMAGKSGKNTGLFADWFYEKTSPLDDQVDVDKGSEYSLQGVAISGTELLLYWKARYPGGWTFLERRYGTDTALVQNFEMTPYEGTYHVFKNLLPGTTYTIVLKQFPVMGSCPENSYIELTTKNDASQNSKLANVKYDAELRLLQLPYDNHVIAWKPAIGHEVFYILDVEDSDEAGEQLLARGNNSIILFKDLDPSINYTLKLRTIDVTDSDSVYTSNTLFVQGLSSELHDIGTVPVTVAGNTAFYVLSSVDLLYGPDDVSSIDDIWISFIEEILNPSLNVTDRQWELLVTYVPGVTYNFTSPNVKDGVEINLITPGVPSIYNIDDITLYEGETMAITCRSYGDPIPEIRWELPVSTEQDSSVSERVRTNNRRKAEVTETGIFMIKEAALEINNISLDDSGMFRCISNNMAGNTTEEFRVTVKVNPPGPVANLTVAAVTPYEFRLEWTRPLLYYQGVLGYIVLIEDIYGFVLEEVNITDTFYTKSSLMPDRAYRAKVRSYTNETEGESTTAFIKTRPLPVLDPPSNVTIETYNGTVIWIQWEAPFAVRIHYLYIVSYIINWRLNGETVFDEVKVPIDDMNSYINGLEENQLYDIRVVALTEDGQESYTDWKAGSTLRELYMDESIPPRSPADVYLRAESGNILVTWLPPFPGDNVLIRSFSINVYANGTLHESLTVNHEESSIIVYNAVPGIIYRISVRANNNAGSSLESVAEIIIPQQEVQPFPVENFRGHGLSSTLLVLKWDILDGGLFSHFLLTYQIAGNQSAPGRGNLPAYSREYIVRSLQPYTEYFFEITPYWQEQRGVPANVTVWTFSDKPSAPPTNISIAAYNATTISITCDPPLKGKNGQIISYKIAYRERKSRRTTVTGMSDDEERLKRTLELTPSTVYEFRIKAQTINGSGPWSDWITARTPDPAPVFPTIPQDLKTTYTADTILVTWRLPEAELEHIDWFIVGYGKYLPEVRRFPVKKDSFQVILSGLEPDTLYIVSVRSINKYGESEAAFTLTTTAKRPLS